MNLKRLSATLLLSAALLTTVAAVAAQKSVVATLPLAPAPVVKQIDITALKTLVKPNNKPLLINFWATWCDPCREEFPDLVKIDGEYRGKIDFIAISLDDLAEINRDVPKFLSGMKAEMPAYLLKTPDENAAIGAVSTEWKGGLPFTILFDEKGGVSYFRQGKINVETVRSKINGLIAPTSDPFLTPAAKQP